MTLLDISLLLVPVSASVPCGDSLEYDSQFLELERDAQGKPERVMGDSVQPAEMPSWAHIQQASHALLQRSKDLRVAHYFFQSCVALDGIEGLASSLMLIEELLRQYWPDLHPNLDADDNNDPTLRVNALCSIAGDVSLRLLGESTLIDSRAFGSISLRAAINAHGIQHFNDEKLTADGLKAALSSVEAADIHGVHTSLSLALSTAESIENHICERVGSVQGLDLSALKTPLKHALLVLREYAPGNAEAVDADRVVESPPLIAAALNIAMANREDVLRGLDNLLSYYARHEPSSPLPLLLNRAKSLVHADFAAIVRNLIPDGLSQYENLRGPGSD
jgi:type VI secretion system protein ImpA